MVPKSTRPSITPTSQQTTVTSTSRFSTATEDRMAISRSILTAAVAARMVARTRATTARSFAGVYICLKL